ncbi:MAG TPA: hypothetical protein VG389_28570 [Myxococcota bacterium]|jgi:hypothetical protein|nr:hypothetical protein [Myxococcota bacterium]
MTESERANLTRWRPDHGGGHVESYFLKGNSPDLRHAFWIKFTLLAPRGRPRAAVAEVWAVVFDRETKAHVAVKETYPAEEAVLAREEMRLRFGPSELGTGFVRGEATTVDHTVAWDLQFTTRSGPLYPFPFRVMYEAPVPRSKLVSPWPDERFDGTLTVNGTTIPVQGWRGMQGHNWGSEHTWRYAWAHCNVWEGDPEDTFFEGFSGRVKLGPIVTPWLTLVCLRLRGRDIFFRELRHFVNRSVEVGYYRWGFRAVDDDWSLRGTFEAPRADIVGLYYVNPYGSTTHCLNSKTARAELVLERADGVEEARLVTAGGAALELATTDADHGVRMYV